MAAQRIESTGSHPEADNLPNNGSHLQIDRGLTQLELGLSTAPVLGENGTPGAEDERINSGKREEVLQAFARQFEAFREAPDTVLEDWEAAERGEMAEILDTGKVDFANGVDSFRENGRTRRLPIQAFMNFVAVKADEDEQVENDRRILEKYSRSPISTIRGDGQISRQTHRQLADEAAQATQDRRSAVRRAQTGVRWFYPPKNADINNTTPEASQPQDLSGAMQIFEEALRRYRHANSPIDKKTAKRELDLITRQMGDLTGDTAAVKEFLEARREEARKSGKADRGTASKLEIRASKLRIERAADRLYELEDLRSNEPIILGNSPSSDISDRGSDLPSETAEEIITTPWLTSMIETQVRQDDAPWGKPKLPGNVTVTTENALEKIKTPLRLSGGLNPGEKKGYSQPQASQIIRKAGEELYRSYKKTWDEVSKLRADSDSKVTSKSDPITSSAHDFTPPSYTSVDWSKTDNAREVWEAQFREAVKAEEKLPALPIPISAADQLQADEDAERARKTAEDDKRRAARTAIDDARRLGQPIPEVDEKGFLVDPTLKPDEDLFPEHDYTPPPPYVSIDWSQTEKERQNWEFKFQLLNDIASWDQGDIGSEDSGIPPVETVPPVAEKENVKFNIIFTSLDPAYDQEAEKWAEQKLQQELTPTKGRLGKIRSIRRVAATRITEEGKRLKYTKAYKETLVKAGNPYAQIDIKTGEVTDADQDRDKFDASVQATLRGLDINPEQFVARKATIDEKLQEKISFELYGYAAGKLSPAEIEERFARFTKANSVDLRKYFGKDLDSSDFMAGFNSNLIQKLGEIREAIDHGVITLDQVDFNVGFAIPRWGTETQAELTRRDKLIKGAQKRRKTGVLANPLVLGGGASIGTSLAWGAAGWGARSVAPVVGILPGALIGGWNAKARRSYDLKRDRATFEKDQASGVKVTSDQPRRLALDSFSRRKTSTRQLNYGVSNLISRDLSNNPFLSDKRKEQNEKALQALISRIAEIDVRRKLGISEQTDHVMYSSEKVIQQEKLALEELRLKAIEAVRFSGISHEDYQRILGEKTRKWENFLARTSKAQDKKFDKYRTRESRKAFVEGAVKGAVGAGVIAAGTTGIRMASDALGIDVVGGVRNIIDERIRYIRGEINELSSKPQGVPNEQPVKLAMDGHYSNGHQVFDSMLNIDSATATDTEVAVFAQEAPLNFYDTKLDGKTISIPEHTRLVMDRINGGYDLVSSRDGTTVLLDDVRWEEGKLVANPNSLWADKITAETSTTPDMRRVLGKNGVWKEMATPIKDIDWDPNGTPGKYDKDELGIFNKRDGDAVVFRIPSSSNGFFLNINGDRVWLPETRDGIVRLDPDSKKLIPGRHDGMTYGDVARIAIDQEELRKYHGSLQTEVHTERREIFRVDAIEAGTFRNGRATIHATILGCGETPKEIKMGTVTNSVTKILAGELPEPVEPIDPTPGPTQTSNPTTTPTASPEPTKSPWITPRTTPEPTPDPTPRPAPTPEPAIPTGSGFTFEWPDLSNINIPPTIATPMARRYPLESVYAATTRPTPIYPAVLPPTTPPLASTPHASPRFMARRYGDQMSRGLTDEEKGKIALYANEGNSDQEIANKLNIPLSQVRHVRYGRNN